MISLQEAALRIELLEAAHKMLMPSEHATIVKSLKEGKCSISEYLEVLEAFNVYMTLLGKVKI